MNVSHARVVLRERALVDVLDLTLRFLATHLDAYARLTAVLLVPALALSWAVGHEYGWAWAWAVAIGSSMILQAAFTLLASRLVFEPTARVRDVLASFARSSVRIVPLRLTQLCTIVLGFAFLLVPGAAFAVATFFLLETTLLERSSTGTALARGFQIVGGRSGEAILALFALLALHVGAILLGDFAGRSILGDLLETAAPEPLLTTGGGLLALAGFWLFVPYAATARFFVYLDMRTRAEGWDIQTRFAAIAARATADDGGGEAPRRAA
jgi:hypothetical protein